MSCLSRSRSFDCVWALVIASALGACSVDRLKPVNSGTANDPATRAPEPPSSVGSANGAGDTSDEPDADAGVPAGGDRENGEPCDSRKQCESDHCENGLCCSDGKCCNTESDCAGDGVNGATCEDSESCQGSRGAVACVRNRCRVQDGEDDDSACDSSVEASDCGFYRSIVCNGEANQEEPECPTSCAGDDDCDGNARCRDGECIEAEANGGSCSVASDCASRHCSQGVCCEDGDCCTEADDCPGSYTTPAQCDDMTNCQGTRGSASCVDFMCETTRVDDDAACGLRMLAHDCAMGGDVYCTGAADQRASRDCDTNCRWDGDCPANQHCAEYACIPDLDNGAPCDRAAACDSGYCGGNYGQPTFCCNEGACCQADENCVGRYVCDDRSDCQGTRYEQACSDDFTCEDVPDGEVESNDSGCIGQLSSSCGSNRDAYCGIAADQTRPWCAGGGSGRCGGSGDCDPWLECRDGFCQAPQREED